MEKYGSILSSTSTISKSSSIGMIWGVIESSEKGTLIVSDSEKHCICTIDLPSNVHIIAGNGHAGFMDGIGTNAVFNTPKGICLMNDGGVLVADSSNHRLRLLSNNGVVSVFSGTGKRGHTDGPYKHATWDLPVDLAMVSSNTTRILVTEFSSSSLRCLQDGNVTTIYKKDPILSTTLSPRTNRNFDLPPDVKNPIFNFADDFVPTDIQTILKTIEHRLSQGEAGLYDGDISKSLFRSLNAVIYNKRGDIIILDSLNHAIRHVSIEGTITTLCGNGYPGHDDGISTITTLSHPRSIYLTKKGEIIIADTGNFCLRKLELGSSLKPFWTQNQTFSETRNFNHINPSLSFNDNSKPIWSDLTWTTKTGCKWKIHRTIVFSRCPALENQNIQKQFLDTNCSDHGYKIFWDYIYNDVLPVPRTSIESIQSLSEFLCLCEASGLKTAATYMTWIILHTIDSFLTIDELISSLSIFTSLQLDECSKNCIRILLKKIDSSDLDHVNEMIWDTTKDLVSDDLHGWIKKRVPMSTANQANTSNDVDSAESGPINIPSNKSNHSSNSVQNKTSYGSSPNLSSSPLASASSIFSSFAKKSSKKPPIYPVGQLGSNLGSLLIRDSETNQIKFPDLILRLNVDQLSCHRSILYKRWHLISKQIQGTQLEESKPLIIDLPKEISDMRVSSLYGLLWYFYTSSFEYLKDPEECTELMNMYDALEIDDPKFKAHIAKNGFFALSADLDAAPANQSNCSLQ